MVANEEEIKIRERLTSLETKLSFIHDVLQEIRDDLKDIPGLDEYKDLQQRVAALEKAQSTLAIKVGIASGILGLVGGLAIKMFLG